jgi:hypothetical protein
MSSKTKFLDNPKGWIESRLINLEQKRMRGILSKKYENLVDPNVYWVAGTDEENEGLSTDPLERQAQRITLSQVGVFIAQRMWAKMTFLVIPALMLFGLITAVMLIHGAGIFETEYTAPLLYSLTLVVSGLLILAATIFSGVVAPLVLPSTPVRTDEIDAVFETVKNSVIREHDAETPADLKDRARLLVTDSNGDSVTGQVLSTDLEFSYVREQWRSTKGMLFCMGIAIAAPIFALTSPTAAVLGYLALFAYIRGVFSESKPVDESGGFAKFVAWVFVPLLILAATNSSSYAMLNDKMEIESSIGVWLYVGLMYLMAFLTIKSKESPLVIRGVMIDQAVKESGTELLIDKVGKKHFQMQEVARVEQIKNAKADSSPFIQLGKTTGLLAQRRDPLAPTESDLPMGLTVNDLSTHLGVLGASGTGKTYNVVRPITNQWLDNDLGGCLVLDGKGALPLEFTDNENYFLISPNHGKFNPIQGMKPDAVADVLTDIFDGDSTADPIWSDSARLMLRMAAIIIHASDVPYTLTEIQNFCLISNEERDNRLDLLKEGADGRRIAAAVHYWTIEYPEMPEKTAGSIVNNVRTWLGNILLHETLGDWVDTAEVGDTQTIEDCLTGAKIGLLLPESEFGIGGVAISALCMRRLYDAVKKRGDNWKNQEGQQAVLLSADEVQNLLTKADVETTPVARSLGLYLMFATQNVDGLYKRLDKDGALQLLGNLASLVVFPPRTEDSNKYVQERFSKVWRTTTLNYQGLPDSRADFGLRDSGADKFTQKIGLFRESRQASPRLSYGINLWHRNYLAKARGSLHELFKPHNEENEVGSIGNYSKPTLQFELANLVDANEIDMLLAQPATALVVLNRGRIARRDVIDFGGAK